RHRRYYRELAVRLAAQGKCQILVLCCREQPVAGSITLIDKEVCHGLEILYDERFARASPGVLLARHLLEQVFNRGCYRGFDFMGGVDKNKLHWADRVLESRSVMVMRNSLKMRLLDVWWQ